MLSKHSKYNIKTILIVLGIILTISFRFSHIFSDKSSINENGVEIQEKLNLKSPKMSGYWDNFTFIHIDGNWSTYEWCTGDGSMDKPYLLENITIDASGSPTGSGIFINNSKNVYFIIRNCTVYNAGNGDLDAGIKLENTNNGTLMNNNCSDNPYYGIFLYVDCYNNIITGNNASYNILGIYLNGYMGKCDNNTISENIVNNNMNGIILSDECDNNTISGNNAYYNDFGIYVAVECDNNTIAGNTANNNSIGINLGGQCYNNTIAGNTANNNTVGISIYYYCDNNTISGNTANNNIMWGITLNYECDNNTISGNTANNNADGIFIYNYCDNNTISGNTANNNAVGIFIYNDCDNNTVSGNFIYYNVDHAIIVNTPDCNNNRIQRNILLSYEGEFIYNNGTNTLISLNYYGSEPPSFIVNIIALSFSALKFNVILNISSETPFGGWGESVQIWWNGDPLVESSIDKLGNGLYELYLTPKLIKPDETPILLNMTISGIYHRDKYFEMNITVDPEAVEKGTLIPSDDDNDGKAKKSEEIIISGMDIVIIGIISALAISTIAIFTIKKRKFPKKEIL